jgi:hypothetical protein
MKIRLHGEGPQKNALSISLKKSRRKFLPELVEGIAQIFRGPLLLPISPEEIRQLLPRAPAFHRKIARQGLHLAEGKGQKLFLNVESGFP